MHQEKRPQKALARIQGDPWLRKSGAWCTLCFPREPGSIPMWKPPLIVRATAMSDPLAPTATTFT